MIGMVLAAVLAAEDPTAAPTAEQVRFFETRVRPVLVEHCHGCHGEKKQWAGLRLDSREAVLKGGDSGPAVVPGKPGESLLVRAISHEDEDLKMPEKGRIPDRQIADLTKWVEMGAPFPSAVTAAERTRDPNHWSFQPPADPAVPAVKNEAWAVTALDRFILAKLEAAELTPAEPADRRTLIRRVAFDLTGLPPTPEEVEAFISDPGSDAYVRMVDRLLDSPAYGEKWGRHWLDVARYADSNGLDENVAFGTAYRYRDYVVAAFNRDKPYNQFVREQLAGDLMTATSQEERHEQLIATGFLGLGAKVLAEVDETKMQMDLVDEQIDVFGRAFLGLTLGCARCHDHKFDPIETADYYGFAGIFKSTRAMETYTKLARWHENVLPSPAVDAMKAEYEGQLAAKKQAISEAVAKADEAARASLATDAKPPEKLETLYPDATKAELKKLRDELTKLEKTPPEYPTALGVIEDKPADVPIHVRGSHLKLGEVVARHTPPVLRGPEPPQFTGSESGRRELAEWLVDPRHPLTARVFVNRVWRWHFGTGLVRSTDNFGLLSDAPSHPELLDWLARRFIEDGWSMKALHRRILNSATYRQSSVATAETLARDPENRLYSRANVRRLEAEEVRDAWLAVSGKLDRTLGGSLLAIKNREYLFDHTSIDRTDYTSYRRSLYLPIIRNNVYDLFQLLDFPDPTVSTSDRSSTTVALQALLALNSPLVLQCASDLADRCLAVKGDDSAKLTQLSLIAYGRRPTVEELAGNTAFLAEVEQSVRDRRQAWNTLCHVVLAANEFVYVK